MEDVPPTRIVRVNGTDLIVLDVGEGETIIGVHGSVSDYRVWYPQLGDLSRTYRFISYSRRYHWPNEPPSDGVVYRATQHVADLIALVKALGVAPVHVICESYGGDIALAAAASRPELFRSLVLGEPPLYAWLADNPDGTELFKQFTVTVFQPAGQAFARGDARDGMRFFLDGVVGSGTFDSFPPEAQSEIFDNTPEMRAELSSPPEEYFTALSREDLARLTIPVLLIEGEHSPPNFGAVANELARTLPNVERVTIPDASHIMNAQNPDAYNAAVLEFLDRQHG